MTTGDRAVGATLAGVMSVQSLPPVEIRLRGYAGQALGFALVDGIRLELTGYANDSVGEAMAGG